MARNHANRPTRAFGLVEPNSIDEQNGTGVTSHSSTEYPGLAQPCGLEGAGQIRTDGGTALQAVAFDHSATAPPVDPISPLAGPLRGKKFPAVLVEDRGYETPCHVWQGSHNSRGYPLRGFGGRAELLHRRVCEHHHGPMPEGAQAHHACGVKSCVNPAHLQALSVQAHSDERYPFPARAFVVCLLASYGPLSFRWIAAIGRDAFGFTEPALRMAIARLGLEHELDASEWPPTRRYYPPVAYVVEEAAA